MEIQVKEVEYCKLHISCVASQDEIEKKRNEVVKVFKRAPMPGYRKGKATVQAIKHHYKNQIDESLRRALAEEALQQSIVEKAIKPLGNPQFTEIFLHADNFSCQFTINNKPEFELIDLSTLEIPKPHSPMTAEDYAQKVLQNLRTQYGEKVPFGDGDVAQLGDVVSVSYDVFLGEEKQDSLCAEGELITLGSSTIAGLDQNICGMKPGDSLSFNLTVPENANNQLAGKVLTFNVNMHMGMRVVPAALDGAFAAKFGKASYQELEDVVRADSTNVIEQQNKKALQQAVIARVVSSYDFKIPDWLALTEAQYLATSAKVDWNTLEDQVKETYIDQATKNVKLSLILDKIRDNEPEAQMSDQEVMTVLQNNLNLPEGKTLQEALKEINSLGYMQVLYSRIRDDYTLDFVVKSVKVIE